MKLQTNKSYQRALDAARQEGEAKARQEVKGYYGDTGEQVNEYLAIIQQQARGMIEIQAPDQISREELKRTYDGNGPVFGVIDKIATAVAACAPYLEVIDRKTGDVVTDPENPVVRLLKKPNDRQTRKKYFYGAATNRYLFGDQWNYVARTVGKDRAPAGMYIIPSQTVAVKHDSGYAGKLDNGLFEGIVINGKQIKAADVFENFSYNLDPTTFFGTSRVSVAATYLTVMERAIGREATALKNGGAANIITPADTSTPALPKDKDDAEQRINAQGNTNKTLMLRIPVAVHSLGNKPADLSILESHKEAITALCFVFGIPVDLYYGQAKYENAKEAKKTLYESCAIPFLEEWGEDLLSFLELSGKYELKVNTDKIRPDRQRGLPHRRQEHGRNRGVYYERDPRDHRLGPHRRGLGRRGPDPYGRTDRSRPGRL